MIKADDRLVCMGSSQLKQADPQLDEPLLPSEPDFPASGLKVASVIRVSRLAVLDGTLLAGAIGDISDGRLTQVRQRLSRWIIEGPGMG